MSSQSENLHNQATLIKRILAIFYDSFLLIAVLFLAMALLLLITGGHQFEAGNPLVTAYLLCVCLIFFGWFWTHGGQTLGMRAWKIQIQQNNGKTITWRQVTIRFITAVPAWLVVFIGIALTADIQIHSYPELDRLAAPLSWLILAAGIIWIIFDQWPGGWRDKVSGTRIIKTELSKDKS